MPRAARADCYDTEPCIAECHVHENALLADCDRHYDMYVHYCDSLDEGDRYHCMNGAVAQRDACYAEANQEGRSCVLTCFCYETGPL